MTDLVLKDIGDIHSRLFQHNAALQGEISYFEKEFEGKRNDREVMRIRRLVEHTNMMNEKTFPETAERMEFLIKGVLSTSRTCSDMLNKVLEKEEDRKKMDILAPNKKDRSEQWSLFIGEMCAKSSKVDKWFNEQKLEMETFYSDLESKMHIIPSPPS